MTRPPPGRWRSVGASASVRRLARVDLVDPRHDAAAHVDGVGVAGALDDRERLGRAHSGLAVHDDLLVAGQLLQGRAVEEVTLGDQHRTRDLVDLELVRLPDVDQYEVAGAL